MPRSFGNDTGVVCQKEVDGRASGGECVRFEPARYVGHNERIKSVFECDQKVGEI